MIKNLLCLIFSISAVAAEAMQKTYMTKLDHYSEAGDEMFQARYIIDDQYWKASDGDNTLTRPILFYCGNEGDIWGFYKNSGFITDTLAKKWGALVVFAEHRYFGQSRPFGKQSYEPGNNVYLTVDNTLMDYVELIKSLKTKYGAEDKAVIAFGGSYGGMLAAWMRMKHPHVIQGALASSAPIFYFKDADGAPETKFFDIITKDFNDTQPNETTDGRCMLGIREGFNMLDDINTNQALWPEFKTLMNLCDDMNNSTTGNLYDHLSNGFAYMAMTDYPSPASFLQPMPAFPVNASCEYFADVGPLADGKIKVEADPNATNLTARQILVFTALRNAANVYFDYANKTGYCMDADDTGSTGSLDGDGWNVLQCNQLPMPNSTGDATMFLPYHYDYIVNTKLCQDRYGLTPDYDWALREFGGYNITRDLNGYNNIIFSNGNLDPWTAGGVKGDQYFLINLDLPYYVIQNGAHHLDLRLPNEYDVGTDVEWVRNHETIDLESWIVAYQTITSSTPPSDSPMVGRSFENLPAGFIQ